MKEQSGYVTAGDEELHYRQWGEGKDILLAFHGYGNDAEIFGHFKKHLQKKYTILSFDLPHHGKSKWSENTPITKPAIKEMVVATMKLYKVDKISLLGYSMGGRVCLTIVELLPEKIDKVTLIASDGLTTDFYYYFLTHTIIGKKLFKHFLNKPTFYFGIIEWLKEKKWIDAARHKFVMQYLHSEERRKFLWQVWPAMNKLIPDQKKLKTAIHKYHIPIHIFMGAYDKIMPPVLAKKFKSGLSTVTLTVLDRGHRAFDYDNAHQIAESLL